MSDHPILVSGCGLTFSRQERKTWVNILESVGVSIADVSGPAVSNQWVLNQAIKYLQDHNPKQVVLQLTSLNKLEVIVDEERKQELVNADSLRNFTINNVWPSSHSAEHISKELYYKWLSSPELEMEDITCKLYLLSDLCKSRNIGLWVYQGYEIPWNNTEIPKKVVANFGNSWYNWYKQSELYQYHDTTNSNAVPCMSFHAEIAHKVATDLQMNSVHDKIVNIKNWALKNGK